MNKHFIDGFVKAAQAAGIPDQEIPALLEQAQQAGGAAEAPGAEAAPAQGGEHDLEALLSSLSPEELEQLATELAGDIQGGGGEDAGHVSELAQAISQHLGEHPEVAEMTAPEANPSEEALAKQSAVNFIKSAEYVEGFLEQALGRGLSIKEAVDMYDSAFTTTLTQLKTSELKGDQHKLDVDKDGKIEGSDLAALRAHKKHEDSETPAEEKKEHEEEKTAAYYEGLLERAREFGLSDAEALQVVKEAMEKSSGFSTFAKGAWSSVKDGTKNAGGKVKKYVSENKPAFIGGAVGGVAGGAAGIRVEHELKHKSSDNTPATEKKEDKE